MLEVEDDRSLVVLVGRGDQSALAALYERHRAAVFAFAAGCVGGDREAATAVLRGTFVAVWREAPGYDGRTSARAWLYRITRSHAGRLTSATAAHGDGDDDGGTEPGRRPPRSPSLDAALGAADRDRVAQYLGALPQDQRELLTLASMDDTDFRLVADVLDIPFYEVYTRLVTARTALAHAVTQQADHP